MPPLKLCYVGWADHVHLERWAGYFAKRGHEVSVISFSGLGHYPTGVKQYRLGLRSRGPRWRALKLRFLLSRIRPNIVHVHWAHFAYVVRRAWAGPLMVTVWGSELYQPEKFSDQEWAQLLEALQHADLVTCDSEDLASRIRRECGVKARNVSVIQWGVDTDLFTPAKGQSLLAQELSAVGRPVILSARNFTPVYNQETVVAAFAKVVAQLPTALLMMKRYGGDPEYFLKIRSQIESLGLSSSVRIVDTVSYERMPDLYRMARVTVSVPRSDATPMALLEAMACGSAPIVSDLPSLREWIVDGSNGFLVTPEDISQLSACMERLLTDSTLAAEFARKNLEIVRARASQAANMERMEAYYRELGPV